MPVWGMSPKDVVVMCCVALSMGMLSSLCAAESLQPPVELKPGSLRIHYQSSGHVGKDPALWLWDDFLAPSADWPKGATPFSGKDAFGWFADVEMRPDPKKLSFLVLDRVSGAKDAGNKTFHMSNNQKELWIKEGDDTVYLNSSCETPCEIQTASITGTGTVKIEFKPSPGITPERVLVETRVKDAHGRPLEISAVDQDKEKKHVFVITVPFDPECVPITVSFGEKTVVANLSWKLIDALYAYSGNDLGCTLTPDGATLKLWAPLASAVNVLIFDRQEHTRQIAKKALSRQERGIWMCRVTPGEIPGVSALQGYYYQYEVINPGELPKRVLDPYAFSMAPVTVAPSGTSPGTGLDFVGKAAFVNPAEAGKPPRPVKILGYSRREDAVIYEVHIRDFTSDPAIEGVLGARWGSYRAFKDRLEYIKSLGVTHVQLLPVMAWYFGDETAMNTREMHYSTRNNQYNWGYDPHNYFSPDGAYSENPADALQRIAELKDLIDAVHAAGMGVILDVVYTHMAKAEFLNDIVPNYYFFQDAQGGFVGDFGNNLATTRKMAEKLMVDSVQYWFREYRIDGMRWDMMGDATYDSVQRAYDAAAAINPQALFLGEGWRTFKGHLEDPALKGKSADQDWMALTDSVGVFSDEWRNELKSGFGCEGEPRFLTGGARNLDLLFRNLKAQPTNTPVTAPGDMVQYIEAHDNMPLYDVIAQSIKKDPDVPEHDREIHRRVRLGNLLVLTSQGTAFLHAGQEWGRSKQWRAPGKPEHKYHELVDETGKPFRYPYFVHDSYDSSDAINRFDWVKATDAQKFPEAAITSAFTRGLIALRRSADAFRLPTKKDVDTRVHLIAAPELQKEDLVIAFSCKGMNGATYYVFANADQKKRTISLPVDLANGDFLVDATRAGTVPLTAPEGVSLTSDRVVLQPLTGAVIRVPASK